MHILPFYFATPTLSVSYLATLAMDCGVTALSQYDATFQSQLKAKTIGYKIIENGQGRELILTDMDGDRILYIYAFLNTQDFNQGTNIELSPNPANDFLIVTRDNIGGKSDYKIVDLTGKIVRQDSFANTIYVNTLSQGLYFKYSQHR